MTANVSIIVAERNEVLKIPNSALRYRPPEPATNATPSEWRHRARPAGSSGQRPAGSMGARSRAERRSARTVYVLKDNKPQPVQIKTGITDGIYTEVTEGLGENDKVITSSNTRPASGATPTPANPFGGGGGGMRRF